MFLICSEMQRDGRAARAKQEADDKTEARGGEAPLSKAAQAQTIQSTVRLFDHISSRFSLLQTPGCRFPAPSLCESARGRRADLVGLSPLASHHRSPSFWPEPGLPHYIKLSSAVRQSFGPAGPAFERGEDDSTVAFKIPLLSSSSACETRCTQVPRSQISSSAVTLL